MYFTVGITKDHLDPRLADAAPEAGLDFARCVSRSSGG